jgi:hypothetical protein
MSLKKSNDSKAVHASNKYIAIPRAWAMAIAAVLVAPWIIAASVWLELEAKAGADVGESAPVKSARAGRWGDLKLVPIVISPPEELVFTDWGFMPRPTWAFPGANADKAAQMLQSAGVSAADAARLQAEARSEPRIAGVVLMPDPAWVRALSPETRARIYHMLAKSSLNVDQTQAFRYLGANPEAWFGNLISPHTRQLIEPLIYRDGDYMLFSDIELVRPEIGSKDEMQRLGKVLCRQPTVIANLSIDRTADLDELVEYWGRGGRRTDIRPLLESIAGNGTSQFIDVIHLLPPFARNHLYRYPKLSAEDLDRPAVVNCLWTSLNFFLANPDNRFLDASAAIKALKENYYIVESDYELGDIVAFLDNEGNIFHAAVYIAGDLVFSKNGVSAMAPWTLMTIDDVKGYYRWRFENPRVVVHRRNDF